MNTAQVVILAFAGALLLGIYLGYIAGRNDGRKLIAKAK